MYDSVMKEIGGYFSLELNRYDNLPHKEGVLLNTGRNSLEYILRSIPDIKCLYIPYFTCNTVLEPLQKLSIEFQYYQINTNLELLNDIVLKDGEYLLYTNYFGIKDDYVLKLDKEYGRYLIMDNSQALFSSETFKCLYSPRKFVGVPDGGIAITDCKNITEEIQTDISYDKCSHLLIRLDTSASNGYSEFRQNSQRLKNQPMLRMSSLTRALLQGIDFIKVKNKHIENYQYLNKKLALSNKLKLPSIDKLSCPMVYPYMVDNASSLKKNMIENKIYVATYWPNVLEWCDDSMIERYLAEHILPLPIDQRYDISDMNRILSLLKY